MLAQGITEGREEDIEIAGIIQNLQKFSTQETTSQPQSTSERRRNLQLRYLPAEIEQIKQAGTEGFNLNHLHVYLQKECLLKGARAFMILRELEAHGEIIRTVPSAKELEDERFDTDLSSILAKNPGVLVRF